MPDDWVELGKFPVFVVREHINGNVTVGNLLVDIFCTGVKDAHFWFNEPSEHFHEIVEEYEYAAGISFRSFDYNLVHNIIYEAVEFASSFGIEPHTDFRVVEFLLEEDDESIPLIPIPLGSSGKPLLVLSSEDSRNDYYLRQLEKYAGEGNYEVIDEDEELNDVLSDFTRWSSDDWRDFIEEYDPNDWEGQGSPVLEYVYYRCVYMPDYVGRNLAAGKNIGVERVEITAEPLDENEFTFEENEATRSIFERLNRTNSKKQLNKLSDDIKELIERWPANRQLHNYLSIAYEQQGRKDLKRELLNEMHNKFPDYFFGVIGLAGERLEANDIQGFLNVFNGKMNIKDAFPKKKNFHIMEFLVYHTLLGMYYLKIDDLTSSYMCKMIIEEVVGDFIGELPTNEGFFLEVGDRIEAAVSALLTKALADDRVREEILVLLVESEQF